MLTIPPWATVAAPADIVGFDTLAPHRHRRFWISYDRRGTGASQRDVTDVSFEAQIADIEAILDALSVESCDITAYFEGGAVAIAFAARHPGRVRRLVLWQPFAIGGDFMPAARIQSLIGIASSDWPLATRTLANVWVPRGPVEVQRALARGFRERLSADTMVRYLEQYLTVDVREDATRVAAETLVMHPAGAGVPRQAPEVVAALIPNATLEHVEQTASFVASEGVAGRIIDFVDGVHTSTATAGSAAPSNTAIILFTDIADSTALTERMGDAPFRAAARALDDRMRAAIRESGGTPVEGKVLGDGVMAVFTSAAQAIDAARRCVALSAESELQLHVGLHAGDVIRERDNVYGGAVNIASRICGLSAPGEILVSATIRDLARTSADVTFDDRGEHALKGIDDPQRVFAVRERG
jgi:class 3 adenylate cyclase/pimeloyl-ACP methyl ester carboxylesterase